MGFRHFISGGAMGMDMFAAEAVVELRAEYPEIILEMVSPFDAQAAKWSPELRARHDRRFEIADITTATGREYSRNAMFTRNRYLVANADILLAAYDGQPGGTPMFNARSETAASKVMFKDGMAQRRCIIPASHYFEWEKRGKERIKYAIAPEGSHTIYMAGIYRKEGNRAACTILTRAPAPEIAFIHNRMPVILPAEAIADWLNIRYDAQDVLRSAVVDVGYRRA